MKKLFSRQNVDSDVWKYWVKFTRNGVKFELTSDKETRPQRTSIGYTYSGTD